MSARSLTGPGGRLVGLAVLVVALAGLFAMHGLSAHGAAHSSSDVVGLHAGDDMDLQAGVPAEDGDHDELLALCLALLVVGVAGMAGRGGSLRWVTRDASAPDQLLTTPWTARRDRDPPDLHALSIRRC